MNIQALLNCIFENYIIYISIILVSKYVFLEKGMTGRYGKISYGICLAIILPVSFFLPKGMQANIATLLGAICVIAEISNDSKWAFLRVVPIVGIVNGLLLPIIVLPGKIGAWGTVEEEMYESAVCAVAILLGIVFMIYRKRTAGDSSKQLENRKLDNLEKTLLYFVGVFLLFFSNLVNKPLEIIGRNTEEARQLTYIFVLLGISSFVMTAIVIIIIHVDNKRNHLYNKVADMQYNTIAMMAEIVENRDAETGGHIQRTARYVEIIAKQMKDMGMYPEVITDEYIKNLVTAAPLHDIGKIHVSDVILNKPGRLTKEEYEAIKTHAPEGRKLLSHAQKYFGDFEYLDIAIELAGSHHEWWDGSEKGYPERIAGQEIPLCARIMAVADVFDALTAKRCYKDPMPFNKATNIILEEKGTHFDPDVIEAFIAAIAKIKAELEYFEGLENKAVL